MRNKVKTVLSVAAAGCLALALCVGVTGCGEQKAEDKWEKAIAATVDGKINITEAEVNDYVAKYRAYAGYSDDASWASYLVTTQMTVEDVRSNAIAQVAQNKIIEQYAEQDGVTISDEYLDTYMNNMKETAGIDPEDSEAWTEYLSGMGYTEETYRETVKNGMLLEEVENVEVPQPTPNGDQLAAAANADPEKWTGKNSYTIRFTYSEDATDEEKANVYNSAVRTIEQINESGANLDNIKAIGEEQTNNETAQYAGDAGWDCVQEFPDTYQSALDTLSPGSLYPTPVEAEGGYHIIYCTEEFTVSADGKINVNNMPDSLYQQLESQVSQQLWNQEKNDWLSNVVSKADIKVNKCPEGLPYEVDLSLAETVNTNANESENVNSEAVAVENANGSSDANVTVTEGEDATIVTVGGDANENSANNEAGNEPNENGENVAVNTPTTDNTANTNTTEQ